jgi:hypothetical protein
LWPFKEYPSQETTPLIIFAASGTGRRDHRPGEEAQKPGRTLGLIRLVVWNGTNRMVFNLFALYWNRFKFFSE